MTVSDAMFNALLRIECNRVTCEHGEWRVYRYSGNRDYGTWTFAERLQARTIDALVKRGLAEIRDDGAVITPKGAEVIA